MKPYYEHGGITIYHGDCREVLPTLAFDGVVCSDPPYGIGHYYHGGGTKTANALRIPAGKGKKVAGDDVPFDPSHLIGIGVARILWGANYYADKLPPMSGWLVWDKERSDTLSQSTCELAWTDCVKGVRRFRHLWDGFRRASETATPLEHPTQKPVELLSWCLQLKGVPAADVLDPYMGAGATLVAAKNLGRKAIGIELEERYAEIAARRLSQEVLGLGGAA